MDPPLWIAGGRHREMRTAEQGRRPQPQRRKIRLGFTICRPSRGPEATVCGCDGTYRSAGEVLLGYLSPLESTTGLFTRQRGRLVFRAGGRSSSAAKKGLMCR